MTSRHIYISLLIVGAAAFFSVALVAGASLDDVKYPVKELGNCKNEEACFTYCEDRENLDRVRACINFAKHYELLSPEELEEAEYYAITLGVTKGPGGCTSRAECDLYCEDTAHLDACLDFAEEHSLRSAEEIAEGRKLAEALQRGANLPGGCRTRAECETYCENPSRMRECVAFAKQAGFISAEEIAEAEKIIPLLERGEKTPGNCGRKAACEAYCAEASHLDECLAFAEKAGLLSAEELADAKKFAPYIKNGETPGQCSTRAACDTYCSDNAHFDECLAFGERVGLLSEEEIELAKKVKGFGPGGCRSRDACEAFCRDSANEEECLNFVQEHGFEDLAAQIQEDVRAEIEDEVRSCAEKPTCKEVVACFQDVSSRTGRGDDTLGGPSKAKLDECVAEITKELTEQGLGAGGGQPQERDGQSAPRQPGASAEEQRQYDEQYKKEYDRQYQEEYQRQVEEETARRIKEETERQLRQFQQLPQ